MVKKKVNKKRRNQKISIDINKCNSKNMSKSYAGHGCFYGLGFIGAAVYYISISSGFWMSLLGVLKAFVWPAFLIFEILKYLGA